MEIVASWPSRSPLAEVAAYAQRVERLGFDVMHVPETIHDPFAVAALALSSTTQLTVRTSMVVAFPRSPMVTAYAAWGLAGLSDGRFQLGVASQVRGNIVGRFATEWSEPVARLRDYVGALRAIFRSFQTGESLEYDGDHYRFDRLQPYFNPGPLESAAPPIWTGGVNRRMCVLAGAVSDGFVCHPTSSHPRMLERWVAPALAEGASSVGRPNPPTIVANPQPLMARDADGLAVVRESRRAGLAFLYSTPAYRRQLEEFDLGGLGDVLSEMARASQWAGLAEHLTDEVIGMLVPQGCYDEIAEILEQWYVGRCAGLVLSLPESREDDGLFATLVERCRALP